MTEIWKNADLNIKCTCSYQGANHTHSLFTKDEYGNTVENWIFSVNRQKDEDTNEAWFCLSSYDKDNNLLTQIDFDEVSKDDLSKFIKELAEIYKTL